MAVPAGCSIACFRAHELNLCPSTSPTHPGSGNQLLPGMPPLLRRKGRFPQAGQETREQRGGGTTIRSDLFPGRLHPRHGGTPGEFAAAHTHRACLALQAPRGPRGGGRANAFAG